MKKYIYIDESGTLGIKSIGIEPYFIIASLILEEEQRKPIKNLVKKMTTELLMIDPSLKELHACKMPIQQKQKFLNLFSKKEADVKYLVARKDQIDKNLFEEQAICFNYMIFLLLESVLRDKAILELELVIDNRNLKATSLESLEDYLKTKLVEFGLFSKNISVQYGDSINFKHLQAIDFIANAIHSKYNWDKKGLYSIFEKKVSSREFFPEGIFTIN
jgi:hypothetical protein